MEVRAGRCTALPSPRSVSSNIVRISRRSSRRSKPELVWHCEWHRPGCVGIGPMSMLIVPTPEGATVRRALPWPDGNAASPLVPHPLFQLFEEVGEEDYPA